jgi:type VI secretion system protein ImpC
MNDWLGPLLAGFRNAQLGLSAEDVADALWLASHLSPDDSDGGGEDEANAVADEPETPDEAESDGDGGEAASTTLQESRPEAPRYGAGGRSGLYLPGTRSPGTGGGRSVRVPTGAALPGSLALARALRPLRRRVPSRTRRVFDVTETVRRIAEEKVWLPATRPARDRWLDLALVVDAGSSMGVWLSLAAELIRLLGCLSAFRTLRVWGLETDASPPRLFAGLSRRPGTPDHNPRELIDPAGRTLVLVLTDCVSAAWHDGGAARLLDAWGRHGPVTLLQVLPESLWPRSALGSAGVVWMTAPSAAAPNSRLASRSGEDWYDAPAGPRTAVPVVGLVPEAVAAWTRLVTGSASAEAVGFSFELEPDPTPPVIDKFPPSPRTRLQRFWRVASPTARRLAGLLAAAPVVNLPALRLVRQALLPDARQVHEAEVLLGGLLRVVSEPQDGVTDPEALRYDFYEGLRPLLLDAVPTADAAEVLERVSAFVADHFAESIDFRAVLADPSAASGTLQPDQSPFARVAAEVLARLGGDYGRIVSATAPQRDDGGSAEVVAERPAEAPTARTGLRVISGSDDGTLRLWDLDSGALVRELEGHSGWVNSIALTPDGRRAISAAEDADLRVWNIETGALILALKGHGGPVNGVAVTTDGRRAVSASADGTLRLWGLIAGRSRHVFAGHDGPVSAVAFAPDGRRVLSASLDGTMRVWDVDSGELQHVMKGHDAWVFAVAVAPTGPWAVSASRDQTLRVWDINVGSQVRELRGHEGPVTDVTITPDGRSAISSSYDGTLRVWDLESGRQVRELRGPGPKGSVYAVAVVRAPRVNINYNVEVGDVAKDRELPFEVQRPAEPSAPTSPLPERHHAGALQDPPPLGGGRLGRQEDFSPRSGSMQHKLSRVRAPRVHLTYDVEVGGALVVRELPFVIGVLADLSGQTVVPPPPLKDRKFVGIDRDNFDDVMVRLAPRLVLPIAGLAPPGEAVANVELTFRRMDDFGPEAIVGRIEPLRALLGSRERLMTLRIKMDINEQLESLLNRVLTDSDATTALAQQLQRSREPEPERHSGLDAPIDEAHLGKSVAPSLFPRPASPAADSLLDQVILASRAKTPEESQQARSLVAEVVEQIVKPGFERQADMDATIRYVVTRIDEAISAPLRAIMHHPEFRRLEAAWHGLHSLVRETETSPMLKIRVLNVTRRELLFDAEKALEFDQSQLFRLVYARELESAGGAPFGLLVGDYDFDHSPENVRLLTHISQIAAASHAPFVAAASPRIFGFNSFEDFDIPSDIEKALAAPEYTKWRAFRESEDSRYAALTLPRVLARLPFGAAFLPVESFNFEELDTEKPSTPVQLTWMSAAWVFASRVADAFARTQWLAGIRGVEGGGLVQGLPTLPLRDERGELFPKSSMDLVISDRREVELTRLGFLPLCHLKNTDQAVFYSSTSCQKPRLYDNESANANARLGAQINVLLCLCRFMHIMIVISREKQGSFMESKELEAVLNRWARNFVDPDAGTADTRARRPLREAQIQVRESPGKPGRHQLIAYLRPYMQSEELTSSLRLVAEL